MALKATIFRAALNVADMNRHYYGDHTLTIARHPSENDERMMLRIFCFAWFADERLEFTKGLSTEDEPDLWQKDLSGVIEHWIELGQPDEKRLRKASGRAKQVTVICYSGGSAQAWYEKMQSRVSRFNNVTIINIDHQQYTDMAGLSKRTMQLQATIDGQNLFLSQGDQSVTVTPQTWYPQT